MDLSRLSTDALASFAVFADQLEFTRAAGELHISRPALHAKVRKLAEAVPLTSYPQIPVMPDDHPLTVKPRLTLADPAGSRLVALERALRAAQVPWSLAVEAEGRP